MTVKSAKKRKLSRSVLGAVAMIAIALFVFITVFLGLNYRYIEMKRLTSEAFSYARSAAKFIDGDKVQDYLNSAKADSDGTVKYDLDKHYYDVQLYLDSIIEEHALIKYYYVFEPDEECLTYIWDANYGVGKCDIGDTEIYMEGGKELAERVYNDRSYEDLLIYTDDEWGYIGCAFYPIFNSDNEAVAIVGVDISMEGVKSSFRSYLLTIVVVIVFIMGIAFIMFYLMVHKRIVKPINELNAATGKIVRNLDSDETFKIDIHTRDELEELADSFGMMDRDLKDYIKRISEMTAEKERIGAELGVASRIQADMLPRNFPAFPERKDFDIYASMVPAKEVGGDFYDFFMVDDDHIALVMADVSGKGVPAALFMVIAKTLIKNHVMLGESPSEAFGHVNDQLCDGNESEYFVTAWLAVIELSTGRGVAANAGHEHPALRRAGGEYELVVYNHDMALAVMEGMPYEEHEFMLCPGDRLFVYTDGVPESTNKDQELFRTERMLTALNHDPDAEPGQLIENVKKDIDIFVGEAEQFDDTTMLCFVYHGSKKGNN